MRRTAIDRAVEEMKGVMKLHEIHYNENLKCLIYRGERIEFPPYTSKKTIQMKIRELIEKEIIEIGRKHMAALPTLF